MGWRRASLQKLQPTSLPTHPAGSVFFLLCKVHGRKGYVGLGEDDGLPRKDRAEVQSLWLGSTW